jgi:hypothetical protein
MQPALATPHIRVHSPRQRTNPSVHCVLPCRAGCYVLQYSLRPELPGGRTLRFSVDLQVTAGAPVAFDIRVRRGARL